MHSNWRSFLQQQSANIVDGLVTDFGDPVLERVHIQEDTLTDLSRFDILEITGKDAVDFLHGQLSSEISSLAVNELQLSAWCNIKGRVIVSFLVYRTGNGFYLLLERERTEFVVKRLQMFVMRSDLSIINRSDELIRIGIRGTRVHLALEHFIEASSANTTATILPLQDNIRRSIVLLPLEQASILWRQIAKQAVQTGTAFWSLLDIQAGIAWIGKSGSEEFLPQSLNMDLTGALSFDKGCYPGQEIIARMHFRGKLKQRLFLATAPVHKLAEPTTKLYATGVDQHVGMVVNTTVQTDDNCLLLVVLELQYLDNAEIHLGASDGPMLTFLTLPYDIDS